MAKIIDSLTLGSTTGVLSIPYTQCATAAATAAKVATLTTFALETGAQVRIKFTYENSVANPTLNINGTGAKAIFWRGAALASTQYWAAGQILDFIYDGTNWVLITQPKDNNTTYSLSGLGGIGSVSASGTAPLSLSATKTGTSVSISGSIAVATNTTPGVVKIGYTESGKNYPVELNGSNQMYVNVPWENTTYSADKGIKLESGIFSHINSVTARTTQTQSNASPGYGGTFIVTEPKYDAQGHITGIQQATITMPSAQTIPTSLKNPQALTIKTAGTSKGSYDGANAVEVNITAADLGLANAMHFLGTSTTAITDGGAQIPTINNATITPVAGDVVLYGNQEFVYNSANKWELLGDEGSYALKTINVTAGNGLTGGGTLTGNITISHADTSSQNSVSAGTRKYITGVTLDSYGHVTGLTTGTETVTDTNTTYDLAASKSSTNENVKLNLTAGGSGSGTDSVSIKGTGKTTVTTDANGVIIINSTDADTGATSVEVTGTGNAITSASYDSTSRKLTLTKGATYNNYTYTLPAATTSALGGAKVSKVNTSSVTVNSESTIAGRYYPVELNGDQKLIVNVPWTDNNTVTTVTTTGSGNAITSITATNGAITATKGATFSTSDHTHRYVPLAGGVMDDSATLKFSTYGNRFITLSGNSITADMSNVTGGWAGEFVSLIDSVGDSIPMLGWYGGDSGLTHIYMGGTYNDPFMKMTKNGQFTFKNTPYVGSKLVSLSDHTHSYAGSSSVGGPANSVKTNLIIKLNSGTTENTNLFTFNGSTEKIVDITPTSIGMQPLLDAKMDKINPRGSGSFAMNENTSIAIGDYAFIEGKDNSAEGKCAHAEGWGSNAHGEASHAEGESYAEGAYSHAEGYGMTIGEESEYSHSEGYGTATYARASHAGGLYTWATAEAQMAIGKYNAQDDSMAFIIGNGTDQDLDSRSNAFSIDWNGNVYGATFSGNAATATTASKLSNTTAIGSATQPVYFTAGGIPQACTYTLGKSVPADAVFTDTKVTTAAQTSTKIYVTGTPSTGTVTGTLQYNANVYISGNVMYGACWNDYAEYRISDCQEPGRVICENGDDTLSLATERLQPAGNVISDTFGFAIGETEMAKTPIAVSGRVLVYPYEDRYSYNPGDAVCAAPGGTVSKMTREEIITYPERIVGTVSAIPEYETWGEGNVPINGRIWIKVK